MLVIQWLDHKVVGCISTLDETRVVPIQQRKGNELLQLLVEITLKLYQDRMGGVHRGDQYHKWELDLHQCLIIKMVQTNVFWNT